MATSTAGSVESINPATGEAFATHELMGDAQVSEIVDRAHAAFERWRRSRFDERADRMRAASSQLGERREELARLMANEMGKPLAQGRSEIDKCAAVCEYYADNAERFLAPKKVASDASRSFVAHEPLGVVLAIMPWNFPFWQVFRFAAPTLMAGNTGILKHSTNVTGCAMAIEEIFEAASFPADVFRTIVIENEQAKAVIEHRKIAAVTLTGSTRAGRTVASQAGGALKPTVLELGGSDPYIVLADADLDAAVEQCVKSRLINGGQSCIAAKRFIVVGEVHDDFVRGFVERMQHAKMGDPLDESVDIGPQARHDLRDSLHEQVQASIEKGATCRLGGVVPSGAGAYYPPTVLTEVGPGMPAYDEETFGPVAAIIRAGDEDDAVRIANDTTFGLGAAVFTADVERGTTIATERLHAGACFVNAFVRSDPRLPFGGIGDSGYGRELGEHGIREFVNVKTVYVK